MGDSPLSGQTEPVKVKNLGLLIREKRRDKKLTLEQAAEQSGVSAATLSRLESKSPLTPDTRTLNALSRWLGIPMEQLLHPEITQESLPNIVEAHLRADRNLDREAAELLARMFRSAYEAQATKSSGKGANGATEESDK